VKTFFSQNLFPVFPKLRKEWMPHSQLDPPLWRIRGLPTLAYKLSRLLYNEPGKTMEEAADKLDLLSPYVSEDEYTTVRLVIESWRTS